MAGILVGDREIVFDRGSTFDEQCHGAVLREGGRADLCCRSGKASGGTAYSRSPRTWRAARLVTQDLHPWSGAEIAHDQGGRQHLLEVVEQQQDLLATQVLFQRLYDRPGADIAHPEHLRDG